MAELGEHLVHFRWSMRAKENVFSPAEHEDFVATAIRVFVLRALAGVPATPKWHFMLDMAYEAGRHGNPASYATFLDESYNGELAAVARACHARTWHTRVLVHFRWAVSYTQQSRIAMFGS